MAQSLKQKTAKGTLWSTVERFSIQGIQFIVMIIMARLLTPADYGLVADVAIFLAISQSLIDSGFSQALIRKQDRSEIDNSTVFFFNIGIGILLYSILYLCAPLIANFYNEPKLVPITRVIGLSMIFNSFAVVQRALFTITLNFKTQAKASLTGAVISGVLGIWMAFNNWGVWAIVWQQILNLSIVTTLLWILSKWKPTWSFSWASFKDLFGFGSKLMVSGLIDTIYKNLYLIVIGKVFKASDLGYYTRANQFSDFASSNITGIFQRVSYPVLCTIQNDDIRLADVYRRILKCAAFIIFPLMMGLAGISRPLILTLLTEKWSYAATLLIPICFTGMWFPVHSINLNLLQVKGRSDLFLKLEIIKKVFGVCVIFASIPFGLLAMCWGGLISSLGALIINTHYTGKLINMGFLAQMRDLLPTLLLSIGMGCIVYISLAWLALPPLVGLICGIIMGFLIYLGGAMIFRFTELQEIRSLISKRK